MIIKQLYPASIVDELAYCLERTYNSSLIYAWIFTLEGEIQTQALQAALDATLNCYPKLKCILVDTYPSLKRWFRYRWQLTDARGTDVLEEIAFPDIVYNSQEIVNYYMLNHAQFSIDISSHIPLKVRLIRQAQQSFLIFIFHHAATDGLGSFYFIQRFIEFYESIYYQKGKVDYPPDYNTISLPAVHFRWSDFSLRQMDYHYRLNTLLRREPAIQISGPHGTVSSQKFLTVTREVSSPQFKVMQAISRENNVTINDYVLATMFLAIRKWHTSHSSSAKRIYIAVPLNLRSAEDRTVGNIMSGINISFRPESIGSKAALLKAIHRDASVLIKNAMENPRVNLACLLKPIPLSLKKLLFKQLASSASPSLVLSNLGVLSPNALHRDEEGFHYLGPARIRSIHCIPPAGKWTGIICLTYNDQMELSMSVLSSLFPGESATMFLEACIHELLE